MAKLWSGRFKEESSSLLDRFNASLPFDKKLYKYDILGSLAHVKMLAKQKILSEDERDKIIQGLNSVREEIESGEFVFDIKDEDIHMAIEKRLTQIVGDVGKKLHTARSRNDQVAVDFRLYVIENSSLIAKMIKTLMESLVDIAKSHSDTLMPGMTHLQHAQPINFGYHMLAYVAMFKRDIERFLSSIERNSTLPLGCAALAGVPYCNDREFLKKELGFKNVSINCLDTVSDRDFALEALFNISTLMMHISRLSEELIIWSTYEFKFVELSDSYSTGSSIMPQKKNPDVPELLRGKSGRVYGNLISLLTVMKALPLAYNKDTQEDKEGVFDSFESAEISLEILNEVLKTMSINKENMLKATEVGHLSATDLADYLVQKLNIPFREAHDITGRAVGAAEDRGVDLSKIDLATLKNVDVRIEESVFEYLDLRNSMNARDSFGGTSTSATKEQIDIFTNWLEGLSIE